MSHHNHRTRAAATAAAVAVATLGISACGPAAAPPEVAVDQLLDPPVMPTEPYAGPYTAAFAEDLQFYAEEEVVLTAEVGTVVNPIAFTLTNPADSAAAPLLVVNFDDTSPALRPGDAVEVTGTVHEAYNVPDTEENLTGPPPPEVLAHYDSQPFIHATSVHTLTTSTPTS